MRIANVIFRGLCFAINAKVSLDRVRRVFPKNRSFLATTTWHGSWSCDNALILWLTNNMVRPSVAKRFSFFRDIFSEFNDIAHSQHFIDNQNFRFQMSRDSKCETHIHPRRIMLHRRVEKFFHFGKGDDLIKFLPDFPLRHAKDGAVEEDVLSVQ